VLDLVTAGVAAADRWMQHGLACGAIVNTCGSRSFMRPPR
jgi:hypothetical protein